MCSLRTRKASSLSHSTPLLSMPLPRIRQTYSMCTLSFSFVPSPRGGQTIFTTALSFWSGALTSVKWARKGVPSLFLYSFLAFAYWPPHVCVWFFVDQSRSCSCRRVGARAAGRAQWLRDGGRRRGGRQLGDRGRPTAAAVAPPWPAQSRLAFRFWWYFLDSQ